MSNLSLVPSSERQPISELDLVEFDFEAMEPLNEDGDPVPSADMIDRISGQTRLAYTILLKSRAELAAMYRHPQMNVEVADEMLGGLLDTAERLKEMTEMVEIAYLRATASRAAYAGG